MGKCGGDAPISFRCNACGKCCTGSVALTIDECFALQGDFIMGLMWRAQPIGTYQLRGVDMNDEELEIFYAQLRESFPIGKFGSQSAFIQVFPTAVDYAAMREVNPVCPKLGGDGKCSIYERRPKMCRSVPFQPIAPVALQGKILRGFADRYDCVSIGDKAESMVIFDGEKIVDEKCAADFEANSFAVKQDAVVLSKLIAAAHQTQRTLVPSLHDIAGIAKSGGWIETDMLPLALAFKISGLDEPRLKLFFSSQRDLIANETAKALERKDKDERYRTKLLRGYANNYQKFLEKN